MADSVGGPIYIGDTPGGESLPENDSTIDKNQIEFCSSRAYNN